MSACPKCRGRGWHKELKIFWHRPIIDLGRYVQILHCCGECGHEWWENVERSDFREALWSHVEAAKKETIHAGQKQREGQSAQAESSRRPDNGQAQGGAGQGVEAQSRCQDIDIGGQKSSWRSGRIAQGLVVFACFGALIFALGYATAGHDEAGGRFFLGSIAFGVLGLNLLMSGERDA